MLGMSWVVNCCVNFHSIRIIIVFVAPVFFAMVRVVFYRLPCLSSDFDYHKKTMHIILLFGYREGHSARDVAQPCGILSCGRNILWPMLH